MSKITKDYFLITAIIFVVRLLVKGNQKPGFFFCKDTIVALPC